MCLAQNPLNTENATYRNEDFFSFLYDGDSGPLELLEEFDPGWVVDGGRWMGSEECGKSFSVGQGWRTRSI